MNDNKIGIFFRQEMPPFFTDQRQNRDRKSKVTEKLQSSVRRYTVHRKKKSAFMKL